jgi:hypothetical protein
MIFPTSRTLGSSRTARQGVRKPPMHSRFSRCRFSRAVSSTHGAEALRGSWGSWASIALMRTLRNFPTLATSAVSAHLRSFTCGKISGSRSGPSAFLIQTCSAKQESPHADHLPFPKLFHHLLPPQARPRNRETELPSFHRQGTLHLGWAAVSLPACS